MYTQTTEPHARGRVVCPSIYLIFFHGRWFFTIRKRNYFMYVYQLVGIYYESAIVHTTYVIERNTVRARITRICANFQIIYKNMFSNEFSPMSINTHPVDTVETTHPSIGNRISNDELDNNLDILQNE